MANEPKVDGMTRPGPSIPGTADGGSDTELQGWMELWQEEGEVSTGGLDAEQRGRLRSRARRSTMTMWALVILDGLGALVFIAIFFRRAWLSETAVDWALFAIGTSLVVGFIGLLMWNRRGTWRPRNQSTRAHLGLEILRARRKLMTATRLVPAVLAIEVALIYPWKLWQLSVDPEIFDIGPAAWQAAVWLMGASAVVLLTSWLFARKFRRDLDELTALMEDLDESESEPGL